MSLESIQNWQRKYTPGNKLNVSENSQVTYLTDANKEGVTASFTPVKSKRKDTGPRQESGKIVPVKTRVMKQKRKPPTLVFFHVWTRDISNVTVTRICSNT